MFSTRVLFVDTHMVTLVTWAVMQGVRMFNRVSVQPGSLVATKAIPKYDFAVVVPSRAVVSAIDMPETTDFPIKVHPGRYGEELNWWSDMTFGSFAFVNYLAYKALTDEDAGVRALLNTLHVDPSTQMISLMAEHAQKTTDYASLTSPVINCCRVSREEYDTTLVRMYCLLRRHGTPLWSSRSSGGLKKISKHALAREGKGEITGIVPIISCAAHSDTPNATVGFPDAEMLQWLAQERGLTIKNGDEFVVLQALEDIETGEPITASRNQFYNFSEEMFQGWFGIPLKPEKEYSETEANVKSCGGFMDLME